MQKTMDDLLRKNDREIARLIKQLDKNIKNSNNVLSSSNPNDTKISQQKK